MHWRNIAPFCRDDDPQTGPTIRFPATSRHSGLTKVSTTESHGRGRKESLKFILSHSAAQRCVHALAPARGRQRQSSCPVTRLALRSISLQALSRGRTVGGDEKLLTSRWRLLRLDRDLGLGHDIAGGIDGCKHDLGHHIGLHRLHVEAKLPCLGEEALV